MNTPATALRTAAYNGDFALVQWLLREGVDPNVADDHGRTALTLAAHAGHSSVVSVLISSGAWPDPHEDYDTYDTPLTEAASHGRLEIVKALIAAGADHTFHSGIGQRTAEDYARTEGHKAVVEFLATLRKKINVQHHPAPLMGWHQVLETQRTILREFVPDDADDLMRIFSDASAMEFAPMGVTHDRAVAERAIEWHLGNYRKAGYSAWAAIGKTDGKFVGLAGILPHEIGTELFCSLVPEFWGCGLGTELALACRDYAFQVLKIERLISLMHPDNTRAAAVARKVGMIETGTVERWGRRNRFFELKNS